jgi:hypothetical protein
MKNNLSNNREINRYQFNSLSKPKSNSDKQIKQEKNLYSQPQHQKKNNISKFQNMSKLIVSKIDEILKDQPLKSGSISSLSNHDNFPIKSYLNSDFENSTSYSNLREDLNSINKGENLLGEEKENLSKPFEKNLRLADKIPSISKDTKIRNKSSNTKHRINAKNKKETFMTDVGIENIQNELEPKKKSKYMEAQDKHVREILDNLDDSDGILDENEEKEFLRSNPDKRNEVMEIKNLIAQVDNYKKSLTDEFDELQFLIKFVEDTEDRINRHKQGVSKIFKKAGMKKKTDFEIPEEQEIKEERTYFAEDGSYDSRKNLNLVKSNLNKIYDSMLGFYAKMKHPASEFKESEVKTDLNKFKRKSLKK